MQTIDMIRLRGCTGAYVKGHVLFRSSTFTPGIEQYDDVLLKLGFKCQLLILFLALIEGSHKHIPVTDDTVRRNVHLQKSNNRKTTMYALRKHVYSNILKISPPKTESFQLKILICFTFLLKTYIMGTR